MIRLALACAALCVLCVAATMAAGTPFAVPLALAVVGFAVWLVWHDDRALGDLAAFERRERMREAGRSSNKPGLLVGHKERGNR